MELNHNYMIFILMPMKHNNIVKYMPIMMQSLERIEKFGSLDKTLINKFKQDDLKKYLDNIDLSQILESNECVKCYSDMQIHEVCEFYPQMSKFTELTENNCILYEALKHYYNNFLKTKK